MSRKNGEYAAGGKERGADQPESLTTPGGSQHPRRLVLQGMPALLQRNLSAITRASGALLIHLLSQVPASHISRLALM